MNPILGQTLSKIPQALVGASLNEGARRICQILTDGFCDRCLVAERNPAGAWIVLNVAGKGGQGLPEAELAQLAERALAGERVLAPTGEGCGATVCLGSRPAQRIVLHCERAVKGSNFEPSELEFLAAVAAQASLWLAMCELQEGVHVGQAQDGQQAGAFQALLASDFLAVAVSAPDGKLVECNSCFLQLFGFSDSDLKEGRISWQALGLTDLRALLPGEGKTHQELELKSKDGSLVEVLLSSSELQAGGVQLSHLVDVTAQKRAERDHRFLVEASSILSSTLDYETTLTNVARLAIRQLADWCSVDLLEEDGTVTRVAIEHQDPNEVKWAKELQERYPVDMDAPNGVAKVIKTGESELASVVTEEMITEAIEDPELVEAIKRAKIASALIVPLTSRGITIGALTLISSIPGRFQEAEVPLAEELGHRAGISVDKSRLFRKMQVELAERQRIQAALVASERTFRTMADSAPVLIWMSGADKRPSWFNERWLKFTGRAMEDELKDAWEADIHPEDRELCRDVFNNAFDTRRRFTAEIRIRRRDGKYRWMLDSGVPLHDYQGQFLGYIGSCVDITERKEAEQAIHQINAELERRVHERTAELIAANKELETFSYSVSHDLRAPLRTIATTSKLLVIDMGDRLKPEEAEMLERQVSAAQRMSELIDALLQLSRIGRGQLKREPLDLSLLAAEVAADVKVRPWGANTKFAIEPGMLVRADARLLRAALENLIDNACKFSSTSGRQPLVEVGRTTLEQKDAYFVRDNGLGFDPEFKDKLFQPFERLAGEDIPGLGVGLANVQRIIQRHGGQVVADSELNKGATFTFTLG